MPPANIQRISREIKEGICNALGCGSRMQLLKLVQLEVKPGKLEPRIIAVAEYSLYIITAKVPIKMEQAVNFLDIKSFESPAANKVTLVMDTKKITMQTEDELSDVDELISCIIETLVLVFPSASQNFLNRIAVLTPQTRLNELMEKVQETQTKEVGGPCGSFSFAYHFMCDYHNAPFVEEVAWDIDTIYLSQDSKELALADFDHLDAKMLTPIISALEYNGWFTKLNLANIKLTPEALNEVLKVMKTNTTLQDVSLSNTGLKPDFMPKLAASLQANTAPALISLNLSGNSIEDKGLLQLLFAFGRLSPTLKVLNLSKTGITAKGVNKLAEVMLAAGGFLANLTTLDLSENSLKNEEINNLYNYLAQPNVINCLNLAGTECVIEPMFGALVRGCCQHLTNLDVSRCTYSKNKKSRDVPLSWKEFFSSSRAIQCVNFSGSQLPAEALKFVLLGLNANTTVSNVKLNVSSNGLGSAGCQVLECFMADVKSIESLDISDNGFDQSIVPLLSQLGHNRHLKQLRIGRNVIGKPKQIPLVMDALVNLLNSEISSLECLHLDDMKLKNDLFALLAALGSNSSLREIDISGNMLADAGARMLAKALLVNKKLATITWDRNGTTALGFADIASALEKNFTLKSMALPLVDIAAAIRLSQEKTESAVQKIEALLQRNQVPHRLAIDKVYRLHNGLVSSSTQQILDSTMAQLQTAITRLQAESGLTAETQEAITTGLAFVKDATAVQQLLIELQGKASEACSEASPISDHIKSSAAQLQKIVQKQLEGALQKRLGNLYYLVNLLQANHAIGDFYKPAADWPEVTANGMVTHAASQCSAVLHGKLQDELKLATDHARVIPDNAMQQAFAKYIGCDVLNYVDEINFSVANLLYGRLIEETMIGLDCSLKSLQTAVTARQSINQVVTPREKVSATNSNKSAEEAACIDVMRKSMFVRKLRPVSSLGQSQYDVPDRFKRPSDVQDNTSSLSREPEVQQSKSTAHQYGTVRSIFAPSFDLDAILPDRENPKLQHLSKDRPKQRKTHFVKRPVVACESLLVEDADIDELARPWGSRMTLADITENMRSASSSSLEMAFNAKAAPTATRPRAAVSRGNSANNDQPLSPPVVKTPAPASPENHAVQEPLAAPANTAVVDEPARTTNKQTLVEMGSTHHQQQQPPPSADANKNSLQLNFNEKSHDSNKVESPAGADESGPKILVMPPVVPSPTTDTADRRELTASTSMDSSSSTGGRIKSVLAPTVVTKPRVPSKHGEIDGGGQLSPSSDQAPSTNSLGVKKPIGRPTTPTPIPTSSPAPAEKPGLSTTSCMNLSAPIAAPRPDGGSKQPTEADSKVVGKRMSVRDMMSNFRKQ